MFNNQIIAGSSGQGGFEIEQSLKFNDDESQYLSWTPASAGNRKTWTFSAWVKQGSGFGVNRSIFSAGSVTHSLSFRFTNYDRLFFYMGSTGNQIQSAARYRDPSAFMHLCLSFDTTQATASDRVKMYVNGEQITDLFSTISYPAQNFESEINSTVQHCIGLRNGTLDQPFDGLVSDVYFIDGTALDPTSFGESVNGYWKPKEASGLTYGQNGFHLTFQDDILSEGMNVATYTGNGGTQSISGLGLAADLVWCKRRDAAANHVIYDSVRGTGAELSSSLTAAESTGVPGVTAFDADGFTLGNNGNINDLNETYVGWCWDAGANNTPTGHSAVLWTATAAPQSIRGLGFKPDLVWGKKRTSLADNHVLIDSVRGSTKELYPNTTGAEATNANGVSSFDDDGFTFNIGSGSGSGVWNGNAGSTHVAWAWDAGTGSPVSNTQGSIASTVKASQANGFSIVSYTANGTTGATVGHGLSSAPDMMIVKYRNASPTNWIVYHSGVSTPQNNYASLNGTGAFTSNIAIWNNTAPTSSVFTIGSAGDLNTSGGDYIAYCWHSVAGYSDIGSYTGTGTSGNTINCGFRPGFVMIKNADAASSWAMFDGTRNPFPSQTQMLRANTDGVEQTKTDREPTFTSTGFTIGDADVDTNASGNTYIYMAFKGSYSDYVSDYNTDGSIDSRVKANPSYGFSVATYTGNGSSATVGHGLSSALDMVITKRRDSTGNWNTWHTGIPASEKVTLNTTDASGSDTGAWNSTAPTSTVFSIANAGNTNVSGATYVAYCFHSVSGYSSFGSFSGSGAAGKQVTGLGFKPAWVMIKSTSLAGTNWAIWDNTRSTTDPRDDALVANGSDAEFVNNSSFSVDFLSDGFEINSNYGDVNQSGETYIYMAFADTREYAFWKDVSGNGNNWTPNNLDYRDSLPDTPTNNFAVLNAVDTSTYCTLSEGNTKIASTSGSYWGTTRSTLAVDSGKWYWETCVTADQYARIGILGLSATLSGQTNPYLGLQSDGYAYYGPNGYVYNNNSGSAYGATYTAGDVIGVALDLDGGTLTFYKNGTSQGTAATGLSGSFAASISVNTGSVATTVAANFGQDSTFAGAKAMGSYTDANGIGNFQYAPPTGFLSLCTSNLPTPTIVDGSQHFDTALFTGTGSTRSVTSLSYQPDFTWFKRRDGAVNHALYDVIRGGTNALRSNTTGAEAQFGDAVVTFQSDGFEIAGTNVSGINGSGESIVSWNWKAGGTAVSNTDGSITSSVSANTDMGFSVVSYTGTGSAATVGHGLGAVPSLVIWKKRNGATNWSTQSTLWADQKELVLNSTAALSATDSRLSTQSSWTSTTLDLGTYGDQNGSGGTYIAYCFANSDIIKVGSFNGNGSNQFVYTGFRPAFLLIKRSSNASGWYVFDNERGPYNPNQLNLSPNSSAAESTASGGVHFLSNGFEETGFINDSGQTVIYLAIASTPFKFSPAR